MLYLQWMQLPCHLPPSWALGTSVCTFSACKRFWLFMHCIWSDPARCVQNLTSRMSSVLTADRQVLWLHQLNYSGQVNMLGLTRYLAFLRPLGVSFGSLVGLAESITGVYYSYLVGCANWYTISSSIKKLCMRSSEMF